MARKKANPPAANRGVTKTYEETDHNIRKSVCIDYLTATVYRKTGNITKILPDWKCLQIVEKIAPIYRYPQVYLLRCGGILAIGFNDRQGIKLELSGTPLRECRKDSYYSDELMLAWVREVGRNISRLDIAVDMLTDCPHPCNPLEIRKLYKQKEISTRMRLDLTFKDEKVPDGEGYSVYFGSEQSDQRMVIYDKKAEQHLESVGQWTRLELRLKDAYAWIMAQVIATEGIAAAASSKFKKVFNVKTDWYQALMNAPLVDIPQIKRPESKYERWIMTSVLPSLVEKLKTEPGLVQTFFNELSAAVAIPHGENLLYLTDGYVIDYT